MEEVTDVQVQEMAQQLQSNNATVQRAYLEQRKHLDDEMIVSGKTVQEWKNELWIIIPADALNPQLCIEINMQIMRAMSIASYEYAKASMRAQILEKESQSAYYRHYDIKVSEFKAENKRMPSRTTLETIAEVSSELYRRIATEGDNELKFWKNVLEHLQSCRKIMEQAGINISSDLKYEHSERYLDNMNKKYGERHE